MAFTAAVGKWLFDYLALVASLYAVGAEAHPSLVLLAYVAGSLLGMVPLTPGGLGFVEAGLTGTLALAGVGAGAAVVAVLAYRLASLLRSRWEGSPTGSSAAAIPVIGRRVQGGLGLRGQLHYEQLAHVRASSVRAGLASLLP